MSQPDLSNIEPRHSEAVAAGIQAVDEASRGLSLAAGAVACRDIGQVFDTAIEHGVPIWNGGSQVGCATIYLHAARAVVLRLRDPLGSESAALPNQASGLIEALTHLADTFERATPENANRLGWALRGVFDRFHASRGMEDVDLLLDAARRQGAAHDAKLVLLCLRVAISHGNVLQQSENPDACALLHAYTAGRIVDSLNDVESSGQPLAPDLLRIRGELEQVLASHPDITDDNAERAGRELYTAFRKILERTGVVAAAAAGGAGLYAALHKVLNRTAEEPSHESEFEYHGFISYRRSSGSDAAMALHTALKARGLNAFLDVEGLDSGAFGPKLLKAIERAPNFLVILTPGSLDRCHDPADWLCQEISHAIRTGRRVIPILKDGFRFADAPALPPAISSLPDFQGVTYLHEFFTPMIDRLDKFMRSGLRDLS